MQTELSSNPCPQKSNGGDLFIRELQTQCYRCIRKGNYSFWLDQIESTGELLKTQCRSIPQQLNESLGFRPEKYFLSFLGDLNVQQRLRITFPI